MQGNSSLKTLRVITVLFFLAILMVSLSFPSGNRIYFYLLVMILLYWQKERLQKFTRRVKNIKARMLIFLLIGWIGAIFLELNLASLPFSPKPLLDIFVGTGYYLPYFALWYILLKRYRFNFLEVFYLSGLSKLLFDGLITQKLFASFTLTVNPNLAAISLIVKIVATLVIIGSLTTLPMLLLTTDQDNEHNKPVRQYLLGLSPGFLAVGIFILWAMILKAVFS